MKESLKKIIRNIFLLSIVGVVVVLNLLQLKLSYTVAEEKEPQNIEVEKIQDNKETINVPAETTLSDDIKNEVNSMIANSELNVSDVQIKEITREIEKNISDDLNKNLSSGEILELIKKEINKVEQKNYTEKEIRNIIKDELKSDLTANMIESLIPETTGKSGRDGKDGKDGRNGRDGLTPQKGKDYFTQSDINSIATQTADMVTENYMNRIVSGVTENLMKDGNITLSTYQEDVIDTMVGRLMEETSSQNYIKDQVLEAVQSMISSSLSEEYTESKTYSEGEIITYNGNIYISRSENNNENPETSNLWEVTTLSRLLSDFDRNVTSKLDRVNYEYTPDNEGSGTIKIILYKGEE